MTLATFLGNKNVVPNSNLLGIRFFVYCICIIMWHSHLNDMEIPETNRFIPEGFELQHCVSRIGLFFIACTLQLEILVTAL